MRRGAEAVRRDLVRFLYCSYGHSNEPNSLDLMGRENFVTGGFDRQAIYWKVALL